MNFPGKEFQPITTATVPDSLDFDPFAKKYLGGIDLYAHGEIAYAFSVAKRAHAGKPRDTGGPYFEHPLMCTIYAIEVGFTQPSLLIATLLHDVQEDSLRYLITAEVTMEEVRRGDTGGVPKSELVNERLKYGNSILIAEEFGTSPAKIVHALTKSKGMSERTHVEKIRKGPAPCRPVKGFDRLHNLRTLPSDNPNRIRRKVDETRELFMPLFEMGAKDFPGPGERLLWLINLELERLEAGLREPTPEPV